MSLEVLIGQLHRRLSLEVVKDDKVLKSHLKKKGKVAELQGVEGNKTHVRGQQRILEMLSEVQRCEMSLGSLNDGKRC